MDAHDALQPWHTNRADRRASKAVSYTHLDVYKRQAFAYTGDDVQKNTSVNTAAQETDAAESANAGKTDNTDSSEIDPDMQVLPDGYEVATDANGNLIVTVGGKEYKRCIRDRKKINPASSSLLW